MTSRTTTKNSKKRSSRSRPFAGFACLAYLIGLLMVLAGPSVGAVDLTGQLAQGGMVVGKASSGAQVSLNGQRVKVSADGAFVIGFGWDAEPTAVLEIRHDEGLTESVELSVLPRSFPTERVDGLPPKTVTIPPEEKKRQASERARVASARAVDSDALFWMAPFDWPAEGRVSGVYGSRRILNGTPRSPHYGLDIAAPVSTPIGAPQAGTVVLADADFLLEGGIVIIDHGFGVFSTLFHMHSVDVKVGEAVDRGTPIGTIGATGRASGPHVDWRVNWGKVRLDPFLLVDGRVMKARDVAE